MTPTSNPAQERTTATWNLGNTNLPRLESFPSGALFDERYIVRGMIGHGGMGTVLQVESTNDGRPYALKCCQVGANVRRRFVREVRLLSHLRHPNVVPIVDAGLAHNPPYFVMPLAIGSLQEEVENLARHLPDALKVFRQVCLGVEAIHDAGVIHRDLKPSNVLRLQDGSIAVSDLGAAKRDPRLSSILTRTCAVVGTLAYLAPEQLLPGGSRLADRRSDIYQLGKMLYQFISGRSPALVELQRLPAGLAHVVGRATSASPADRYPDVGSLLAALDAYEQATTVPTDRQSRLREILKRFCAAEKDVRPNQALLNESLLLLSGLGLGGREGRAGLSWFDDLPITLLRSLAKDRPAQFLAILDDYARVVAAEVPRQEFRYADFVASRMKAIFIATNHVGLRTRALQIVLITAVALNRYAAMSVFKEMLRSIKTLTLALPVSEMLRDHLDEFRDVALGLETGKLHPAIRSVLDELSWIETVPF